MAELDKEIQGEGTVENLLYEGRPVFYLWAGILIPPTAYFLQLFVAYASVQWVCEGGSRLLLHVATILALLLCVVGAYLAWTAWGIAGREMPGEGGDPITRTRFMGISGVLMSGLFFFSILAQEMPNWIIGACVGR